MKLQLQAPNTRAHQRGQLPGGQGLVEVGIDVFLHDADMRDRRLVEPAQFDERSISETLRASVRHTDACDSQGAQGTDREHPQSWLMSDSQGRRW